MAGDPFGPTLRRYRRARGLSLRQLGALAHIDFGHLSKVERGKRPSTGELATAVDIALKADGALVAIDLADRAKRAKAAAAGVTSGPMKRRTLINGSLATAIVGISPPGRRSVRRVGRVGVADAQRLHKAVGRVRTLGHQHGGANLWETAQNLATEGYDLLEHGTYTEQVGDLLASAIGRAHMCAGWLAFDSGQQDTARIAYNDALALSRQAENPNVEVHALANLAHQNIFLGQPRQALRFTDAAERVANAHSPHSKAAVVPRIRQAIVYAYANDRRQSTNALADARRRLDTVRSTDDEEWASFVSAAELDGIEATAAMILGDLARAEELLTIAIDAHGSGYARNRALYRVRLAETRLRLGNVTGAVSAADAAVDDLGEEVASWVAETELRDVAQQLSEHRRSAEVEQFLHRYSSHTNA